MEVAHIGDPHITREGFTHGEAVGRDDVAANLEKAKSLRSPGADWTPLVLEALRPGAPATVFVPGV